MQTSQNLWPEYLVKENNKKAELKTTARFKEDEKQQKTSSGWWRNEKIKIMQKVSGISSSRSGQISKNFYFY